MKTVNETVNKKEADAGKPTNSDKPFDKLIDDIIYIMGNMYTTEQESRDLIEDKLANFFSDTDKSPGVNINLSTSDKGGVSSCEISENKDKEPRITLKVYSNDLDGAELALNRAKLLMGVK